MEARPRIGEERPGERATHAGPVPSRVVGVREVPEEAKGIAVDQGGEPRGRVVLVLGADGIGKREPSSSATVSYWMSTGFERGLGDGAQARRGVVGVGHRVQVVDLHLGAAAEDIILVGDGAEARRLGDQPVEGVVGQCDRPVGISAVVS